ncbi:hypothetical protein N8T09_21860 [Enterobacter hormaechei subsp. xiangfangensis]|nr:hypothetical protein [Enterobacter hormaechei subsp. xiangfangensis]MCU2421561.1 hypothetical protein [Enterobacter hormaechei subsp. xiangfangensis]MCU2844049.1 hypothetical protein [Enterobacter hormaechei subsp. xiangfangensis]MCU2945062.1 hypothetical protein [Enterobacter hormaechei subsp. xiangfangensis]MCU3082973.1 hypothetical protein [Enterobacter hormaechei subsp. xiangfangensis]
MREYIDSIFESLDKENYHAALFIALSIPDICGKMETPNERNGDRARRWFRDNLKSKYFPEFCYENLMATNPEMAKQIEPEQLEALKRKPFPVKFDDTAFWKLRNAFLHEASDYAGKLKVHITHSGSHLNMVNGALQLSSLKLCTDIALAASVWLDNVKENPEVWGRITQCAKIKNEIMDGLFVFK